jgi:uncharacterized protein (DUF4415 family)
MKKEYDLSKLKKVASGPVVSKKTTKVSKTMRIDLEIVEWLVIEAERRGVKYQSLVNSLLRDAMQGDNEVLTPTKVRQIVREELKKKSA